MIVAPSIAQIWAEVLPVSSWVSWAWRPLSASIADWPIGLTCRS